MDTSGCDQEPIHIPGSIQPHGILLVIDPCSLTIRNIAGDPKRSSELVMWIGSSLSKIVGDDVTRSAEKLATAPIKRAFLGTAEVRRAKTDISAHISGDFLILELEPRIEDSQVSTMRLLGDLESASIAFDQAPSLLALCGDAAKRFRSLIGYDRVMIYKFLDDGAGTVIAEDRRSDLQSFLHHRFPASDIPHQARALYVRNLLRVIPNVDYVPSVIQPSWEEPTPLDLSDSVLRSVSPIHLQYLRNMRVAASASISIVKDGVLWGLIACHNETPRGIPYDLRSACLTIASGLNRQIKTREETDAYRERLRLRGSADEAILLLSRHGVLDEEIIHHIEEMSQLLSGDGFAVLRGENISMIGDCPAETDVVALAEWLLSKSAESIYSTNELSLSYPVATSFKDVASGVLAILLSVEERWLLIWFRAEEVQTVKWAGNPHKAVPLKPGETLSPRASFEAWQETVHGRSRRWTPAEIEAAGRIRRDLIEIRQGRRLKELNRQLTDTVAEKDLLLEQKKFLIGEVNHRVQNSLQLVSSFLSFQARESGDGAFTVAVEEARRRIMAVSLLHRSLYRGDEIGVSDAARYLEDLCTNLIGSMGDGWKSHFSLNLAPVMLPIDRVIPLGLVVTELVININKYAYGGAPGPVEIRLSEAQGKVRLIVADNGVGKANNRSGFGGRMMSVLVTQLSGNLEFEDNGPGLRAILTAPVAT